MKIFSLIGAVTVLGSSFFVTAPAEAQYYNDGYGYNNGVRNGYGDWGRDNQPPRRTSPAYGSQQYGSQQQLSPRRNSGCSTLSMDSSCF